jgi:hypothetical protein
VNDRAKEEFRPHSREQRPICVRWRTRNNAETSDLQAINEPSNGLVGIAICQRNLTAVSAL